jgi:hypothetical protein
LGIYTVNKGLAISRSQPECHLPNSPCPGIIYPVPGRFDQNKSRNLIDFFYNVPLTSGREIVYPHIFQDIEQKAEMICSDIRYIFLPTPTRTHIALTLKMMDVLK